MAIELIPINEFNAVSHIRKVLKAKKAWSKYERKISRENKIMEILIKTGGLPQIRIRDK